MSSYSIKISWGRGWSSWFEEDKNDTKKKTDLSPILFGAYPPSRLKNCSMVDVSLHGNRKKTSILQYQHKTRCFIACDGFMSKQSSGRLNLPDECWDRNCQLQKSNWSILLLQLAPDLLLSTCHLRTLPFCTVQTYSLLTRWSPSLPIEKSLQMLHVIGLGVLQYFFSIVVWCVNGIYTLCKNLNQALLHQWKRFPSIK